MFCWHYDGITIQDACVMLLETDKHPVDFFGVQDDYLPWLRYGDGPHERWTCPEYIEDLKGRFTKEPEMVNNVTIYQTPFNATNSIFVENVGWIMRSD